MQNYSNPPSGGNGSGMPFGRQPFITMPESNCTGMVRNTAADVPARRPRPSPNVANLARLVSKERRDAR